MVLLPTGDAHGFRRGLGSSLGGATLERGHVVWLALGYPDVGLGWGAGLHPLVDLLVEADVAFGHPADATMTVLGGGGTATVRVGLVRGRSSLSVTARLGAVAYGDFGRTAAWLDLVSPGLECSLRLARNAALHAGLRVVVGYVTIPGRLLGGFEGRVGATWAVRPDLALLVSIAAGTTLGNAQETGVVRLDALVGLEYRFGRDQHAR